MDSKLDLDFIFISAGFVMDPCQLIALDFPLNVAPLSVHGMRFYSEDNVAQSQVFRISPWKIKLVSPEQVLLFPELQAEREWSLILILCLSPPLSSWTQVKLMVLDLLLNVSLFRYMGAVL
jgi:hypothetical protein